MLANSLWSLSAQAVSYSWLHLPLVDIIERFSFAVWLFPSVLLEVVKSSYRLSSGTCLFLRNSTPY